MMDRLSQRRRFPALLCLALVCGLAACDDADDAPTEDTGALCDDRIDNDEDGRTDCADRDCEDFCISDGGFEDSGPDANVAVDGGDADAGADDAAPPPPDAAPDAAQPPDEPLTLNSIVPNRGPTAGGTPVRIVGTGFFPGMQFRFGAAPCADVVVESNNHARCVTPPREETGPVDVMALLDVQRPDGNERRRDTLIGGFTYFEAVTLASVEPGRSPLRGGIEVVLRGTGLVEETRVTIGGRRAEAVRLRPDGALSALVPPGEPGPADVTVANPNGSATLPGAIFYYEDLSIDVLEPPVGPLAGGNRVAIHGAGLTRDSRVRFGDRATEILDADPERRRLEVNAPAGAAAGPVDVTVSNDNGEFTLPGGYIYFDGGAAAFSVTGVAPSSGPVEGGNDLHVAGSGFTDATVVELDGRRIDCERVDAHHLRCTVPPGEAGAVDVTVRDGEREATLADGYTYFQAVTLIAVVPERGSIAGGTRVTLTGSGFTDGIAVDLGGVPLLDVVVRDETTLTGVTPPNTPGPVDVRVSTRFARAVLGGGYTYFDPVNRFGGVWGDPIAGAINVTVLNAAGGAPVPEAAVLAISAGGAPSLEGLTNAQGQLTLSDFDLRGPAVVTAAKEGFEVTTIEDLEVENVTIYLQPNDGEGSPPPGVPPAILRGEVTGLDVLPKPDREGLVNVIVVETTHPTPYDRSRLPPPGPGGLLMEDGPFEIIARPGEMAIIATAGRLDRNALKDFQEGNLGYWEMRQSLEPIAMGIRRFISASPGQEFDDLDVTIDHPMDLVIPVDLDNPPRGPDPGPQFYGVLPRLDFGAEGFWELDTQAIAVEPALTLTHMPRLDGWDPDIRYYLIGLAFSATQDNTPMAVTIEETRDVAAGVFITPFVATPSIQHPPPGGALGLDRRVRWEVHGGFYGPIEPPSANLVLIEEPGLGPPKPLWRYVTPSEVTEFEFPALPQAAGNAGLGQGLMFLTVLPFAVDGPFDYEEFTYDDLGTLRWKGWAVYTIPFRQ